MGPKREKKDEAKKRRGEGSNLSIPSKHDRGEIETLPLQRVLRLSKSTLIHSTKRKSKAVKGAAKSGKDRDLGYERRKGRETTPGGSTRPNRKKLLIDYIAPS